MHTQEPGQCNHPCSSNVIYFVQSHRFCNDRPPKLLIKPLPPVATTWQRATMRFGIVVNDKERQADRQKLAKALKPEDTMFPAFIGLRFFGDYVLSMAGTRNQRVVDKLGKLLSHTESINSVCRLSFHQCCMVMNAKWWMNVKVFCWAFEVASGASSEWRCTQLGSAAAWFRLRQIAGSKSGIWIAKRYM